MAFATSRLRLYALSAALCSAAIALPAGATTTISGGLNLVANAALGTAAVANDDAHPNWSGAPINLAGSVSANAFSGRDSLNVSGSAGATWVSADAGTVDFKNYGWNFSVFSTRDSTANLVDGRGGDDWSYTFTATGDGFITLSYDESLISGDGFGLQGWAVDFTGSGSGAPVLNAGSPDQHGVFTGTLLAGQTYTIGLTGNPNTEFSGGAPGIYGDRMNGDFAWRITYTGVPGVPEPSTWVMMLLGVGLLGAAMRLRGRQQGAALAAA